MKKLYLIDDVNFVILDDDQYNKAKQFKWRLGSARGAVQRNVVQGSIVSSQTLNSFLFGYKTQPLNGATNDYRKSNRVPGMLHHSKVSAAYRNLKTERRKTTPVGVQRCGNGYRVKVQRNGKIQKSKFCSSLREAKAALQ